MSVAHISTNETKYRIQWYDSNRVYYIAEMNDKEQFQGFFVAWTYAGYLMREGYHKNDELNGPHITYHPDGKTISRKATYRNDLAHGAIYHYSTSGKLSFVEYFYDGANITRQVKELVQDLWHITEQEKTLIALQLGITI